MKKFTIRIVSETDFNIIYIYFCMHNLILSLWFTVVQLHRLHPFTDGNITVVIAVEYIFNQIFQIVSGGVFVLKHCFQRIVHLHAAKNNINNIVNMFDTSDGYTGEYGEYLVLGGLFIFFLFFFWIGAHDLKIERVNILCFNKN